MHSVLYKNKMLQVIYNITKKWWDRHKGTQNPSSCLTQCQTEKKVFVNSVQEEQSSVYDTKNTECMTLRGENAVHFLCTPK